MENLRVLQPNKYNVYIGNNITYKLIERFTFDKVLVIADANLEDNDIDNIVAAFPNSYLLKVKAEEANKSIDQYLKIIDLLVSLNFGKCDYILGFGGGVILDLAGFVASTYKRGIKFISIPTSMLAMVDASVGAKVAINYNGIKNLLGTIYAPQMVIVDPYYLHSLPKEHLINGLMEAYKMGLTLNKDIIKAIKDNNYLEVIKLSLEAKIKIVNEDPFDNDLRHVLNFAHTIAHAIELKMNLLHGIAVAACFKYFIKDEILKKEVINDLKNYVYLDDIYAFIKNNKAEIIESIKNDKKVVNSYHMFINEVFLTSINKYEFKDIKLEDYEVLLNE
ncbi:MAG: 3-dehydroquinate synthase [Bacilli bacterium]|nr:3-dehydroquinate synthase [Bacilli bacterium]